jgi:hypothetical protein
MKKRFAAAAGGLALVGAVAVPVGSAFGTSPQGRAIRCDILLQHVIELKAAYHATTDPQEQAFIARIGNRILDKYDRKGCDPSALPTLP